MLPTWTSAGTSLGSMSASSAAAISAHPPSAVCATSAIDKLLLLTLRSITALHAGTESAAGLGGTSPTVVALGESIPVELHDGRGRSDGRRSGGHVSMTDTDREGRGASASQRRGDGGRGGRGRTGWGTLQQAAAGQAASAKEATLSSTSSCTWSCWACASAARRRRPASSLASLLVSAVERPHCPSTSCAGDVCGCDWVASHGGAP